MSRKLNLKLKMYSFSTYFISIGGGNHIDEYKLLKLNIFFVTCVGKQSLANRIQSKNIIISSEMLRNIVPPIRQKMLTHEKEM